MSGVLGRVLSHSRPGACSHPDEDLASYVCQWGNPKSLVVVVLGCWATARAWKGTADGSQSCSEQKSRHGTGRQRGLGEEKQAGSSSWSKASG